MVRTKNQSSSSSASSSTKSPIKSGSAGSGSAAGGNSASGSRQSTHRSSSASNVASAAAAAVASSNRTRTSPGSSPDGDDDTTTTDDLTPTSCSPRSGHHHHGHPYGGSSVHKQNLYVVSFPIIFLFNVLRSLIYQLFCIFRYLYGASTKVIYRPHRRDCNIEIVVQNSKDQQQQQHQSQPLSYPLELSEGGNPEQQLPSQTQRYRAIQPLEMASNRPGGGYSPGPGDPLLAKQKHHHRRAFEYISKALKIDEENEGTRGWEYDSNSSAL